MLAQGRGRASARSGGGSEGWAPRGGGGGRGGRNHGAPGDRPQQAEPEEHGGGEDGQPGGEATGGTGVGLVDREADGDVEGVTCRYAVDRVQALPAVPARP